MNDSKVDSSLIPLDVPFVPDPEYVGLLGGLGRRIHSVHFSLGSPDVADARPLIVRSDFEALSRWLERLPGPRKFLLMNARFHGHEIYLERESRKKAARALEHLLNRGIVDGVVFADMYYLSLFAEEYPDMCPELEALPSVNCMLDTPARLDAVVEAMSQTGFKLPRRINLDRSLNRDLDRLAVMSSHCREQYGFMTTLLANEGCLQHCPYKSAHDALMAYCRIPGNPDFTFNLNRDHGCVRRIHNEPWLALCSPFIRPEDQHFYADHADVIKVCGRNKGTTFLMRAVRAYATGEYHGNLLSILDTLGEFENRMDLPNRLFPGEYVARVSSCGMNCKSCDYCRNLFEEIATINDPLIPGKSIS